MAPTVMSATWNRAYRVLLTNLDTHTLIHISTNEQKKDWFLKLNPNGMLRQKVVWGFDAQYLAGRIPILIDNTKTPPFPVMETSAELLYLLKEFDSKDIFGFKDELERNECLQWMFFWHGSVRSSLLRRYCPANSLIGCPGKCEHRDVIYTITILWRIPQLSTFSGNSIQSHDV